MDVPWDPCFAERSPVFEPLRRYAAALGTASWPALGDLQRLLGTCVPPPVTESGARIAFVPQGRRAGSFEEKYEARIYLSGEVQVREANWHDLLNGLVWLAFPRAKAALNARHYRALLEQQEARRANRGPVQDTMTLFDEGGVIVAAREPELLRMIEDFSWKELFWHRRSSVEEHMRFYLFGHALYEKALRPFSGITGRAILFEVEPPLIDAPLGVQLAQLDARLAARLRDAGRWRSTRELAPLPVLGVPGWIAHNARASYYDDLGYFRPARGRRQATP